MGRINVTSTIFAEPLGSNLYSQCLAFLHIPDLATMRHCAAPLLYRTQNFLLIPNMGSAHARNATHEKMSLSVMFFRIEKMQHVDSAPPPSVTDSASAPSARMRCACDGNINETIAWSKVRDVAVFCRQLASHMSDARRRLRLIVSMLDTHASRAVEAALFLHLSFNLSIEHPDSHNILPHCS